MDHARENQNCQNENAIYTRYEYFVRESVCEFYEFLCVCKEILFFIYKYLLRVHYFFLRDYLCWRY